ncbi:MAG: 50S ribosomal protein L25 [Spirochaetaceae bacterium]|jgi:large subunit ribosomal protein L25|nr:50S ribosomal protein L25 [Spirochaetaceae bacterium]GMO29801.1 MAG: 50S ribosomal protein L25 [Termitinemataceae bacterium]
MASIVFSAKKREAGGSVKARQLRKSGRLPGVIYGQAEAVHVDLDAREFTQGIKGATESTIVSVNIDGKTHEAFIKATQRNIMTGSILHVDFYEIDINKMLRARVPLHIHGNPVGVRDGGVLETPLHEIEVECLPKDLPERINVDISSLKANQAVHVRDIALSDGVKLISAVDKVIALVKYAKAEAAPVVEESAAAPVADAKAAPEKAEK